MLAGEQGMTESETGRSSANPSWADMSLQEKVAMVMALPTAWVWGMALLAAISTVAVERHANGDWSFQFEIKTTTVGLLVLIWLPALVRLLTLVGGKFKGAGVEVSSDGVLGTQEAMVQDLTRLRTGTEEAKLQSSEQLEETLRELAAQVDDMASQYLGGASAITEAEVARLAREYEAIRAQMDPGDTRTIEMTRIVNEARVRAAAEPSIARGMIEELLASEDEGRRLVGLALLQEVPSAAHYRRVLELIAGSASAFEMYHALIALERIAPRLSERQKVEAIAVLEREQGDPRGVGVNADANLPQLLEEVIAALAR
jgi:hypothetical protein